MTDAIVDALLLTLANVEGHAGETFDLDSAMGVLEAAAATLRETDAEDRRVIAERARALAAEGGDSERVEFFENFMDNIGLESPEG